MRFLPLFAAAAILSASRVHAAEPPVIGYLPAFKGFDDALRRADLHQYTHVDLAFANPGPSGEFADASGLICAPAGGGEMVTDERVRALVSKAHEAGAKVLVSVGGGT